MLRLVVADPGPSKSLNLHGYKPVCNVILWDNSRSTSGMPSKFWIKVSVREPLGYSVSAQ